MTTNTPRTPAKHHPIALRLACRKAYVQGEARLTEIARTHCLPLRTLRGWCYEQRWSEARERWLQGQMDQAESGANPSATRARSPDFPACDAFHAHAQERIARLERHLTALDEQIGKAATPDAFQKLATAQQRVFEQWRILSGLPLPGSRRPKLERSRPAMIEVEPLGAAEASGSSTATDGLTSDMAPLASAEG